jgi:hypothetical protein
MEQAQVDEFYRRWYKKYKIAQNVQHWKVLLRPEGALEVLSGDRVKGAILSPAMSKEGEPRFMRLPFFFDR